MAGTEGWAASENFTEEDWEKTSTAAPLPPPPGVYVAKVIAAGPHQSGKGGACAKLEVQVTAVRGGAPLERPRKISDYVSITKEGMYKAKQYTAACGVPKNPANNSSEAIREWCDSLVGQDLVVKLRADSFVPHGSTERVTTAKIDRPFTSAEADEAQGLAAAAGAAPAGGRRRNGAAAA